MARKRQAQVETTDADPEAVQTAIAEGQTLISQGKTKIDAAMAIYRIIETQSQETIVNAFIEGASLTPRGALTYWYTCRRRLARERRADGS